jgi:hypothetical protein
MKITRNQLALILVAIAAIISLDLEIQWGSWFDIGDIHHETWIVAFAFAAIVVYFVGKKRVRV